MDEETDDCASLEERATKLAELTGREYKDVLTDLLDDGKLNQSNAESPDLVEQLKDAAELIATVQHISQDIKDNTVLNGGDNETIVEVKTTLEGDIVDRAIKSVHRKAENLKKILILLSPLFLILGGSSLELMGWINIMDSEEYEGGGDNPSCIPNWIYDDYSSSQDNSIFVRYTFVDINNCELELNGHFTIILYQNGSPHDDDFINVNIFINDIEIQSDFNELEGGTYNYEIEFHTIECDDGTCEHGDEFNSPHNPIFNIQGEECLPNTEIDSPILEADGNNLTVDIVFSDLNDCGQDIELRIEVWNEGQIHSKLEYTETNHNQHFHISAEGDTTITLENFTELNDIPDGDNWSVKVQYRHTNNPDSNYEGEMVDSNSLKIDEVDDGLCEINLYGIAIATNATDASIAFDIDCGYEENNLEGYNVSVQFLVYEIESANNSSAQPILYETRVHYIQGWMEDIHSITLTNFTSNNTTIYDFYWYATWIDGEGQTQNIEQKWINRELEA